MSLGLLFLVVMTSIFAATIAAMSGSLLVGAAFELVVLLVLIVWSRSVAKRRPPIVEDFSSDRYGRAFRGIVFFWTIIGLALASAISVAALALHLETGGMKVAGLAAIVSFFGCLVVGPLWTVRVFGFRIRDADDLPPSDGSDDIAQR